jgi:hypothetical protein
LYSSIARCQCVAASAYANTRSAASAAVSAAFLGSYDDGEWVALVLEDIDGRHPATPWLEHELHSVLTSLTALASELTPSPVRDLPTATSGPRTQPSGTTIVRWPA